MVSNTLQLIYFLLLGLTNASTGRRPKCIRSDKIYGNRGLVIPPDCGTDVNTTCYVECHVPLDSVMRIQCKEYGLWDDDNRCQKDHLFMIKEEYLIGGCAGAGAVLVILTCLFFYARCSQRKGNDASGGAYDRIDIHNYSTMRSKNQGVSQRANSKSSVQYLQDGNPSFVEAKMLEDFGYGDAPLSSAPTSPEEPITLLRIECY